MNPLFDKELLKLPVLSIRQPWAAAILHGGKDVENRDWSTNFRGSFLIHTGKTSRQQELEDFRYLIKLNNMDVSWSDGMKFNELDRGGIIGQAEIYDCVDNSDSPWFMGKFGFKVRKAEVLPFLPCRGRLGFFNVREKDLV